MISPDAGAGVVGGGEHDRVAVSAPGAAVRGCEDGGDLVWGQVSEDRLVQALGGDREDPLGDRHGGRVAEAGVVHEGVDRGQSGVAGADAVAAAGLEVVQEIEHQRCVQVGQGQCGWWPAGALLREGEQQPEGVAGTDGTGDSAPRHDRSHPPR
jgi:hypothetical protein